MNNTSYNRDSASTVDMAVLMLRVVTGLIFFMHGYQKLFDNGLDATKVGFDGMGAPLPEITSVLVTFLELIGGLALIAGAFTRIVSLLFVIDMLAAYLILHIDFGFFVSNGGFELVLILGAAALFFLIVGGGAYSVDEMVGLPYSGPLTAIADTRR